ETALHAHLVARGASHDDDRGVALPRHFGDPGAEYASLTGASALIDLGFRTLVRATGPDRISFLQGMLSNDVAGLAPGEGCPALLLTVQGRVTADLRLAALADEMLLDCDVRARDGMVRALEALLIADDVELVAPEEARAMIGVEGPDAARVLGDTAAGLVPYAHAETRIAGVDVRVQRASEVHRDGFVLHVPAPQPPAAS